MDLFSVFDPQGIFKLNINWISMALVIILLPPIFWFINCTFSKMFSLVKFMVLEELNSLFSCKIPLGSSLFLLVLFIFIVLNNVSGLSPYIFTSTTQLITALGMAVVVWGGPFFYTSFLHFFNFMSHLIPLGTPVPLMPFMVIIECISIFIRPITLSVRLVANLTAGHLLMTLSGGLASLNLGASLISITMMCLLLILESGVSLVQGYVFMLLNSLYLQESANLAS